MKEKTIFDYLNSIYYKKPIVYDKKICNAYLLSLWLSHDKSLIDICNEINRFQFFLPDDLIYKYYYEKVPMGRRYIKWVKKEESQKNKKEKNDDLRKDMMLSKKEFSYFDSFTEKMKSGKMTIRIDKNNASSIFLKEK